MQRIGLQKIFNPYSGCGGSLTCRSASPREAAIGGRFDAASITAPGFLHVFFDAVNEKAVITGYPALLNS